MLSSPTCWPRSAFQVDYVHPRTYVSVQSPRPFILDHKYQRRPAIETVFTTSSDLYPCMSSTYIKHLPSVSKLWSPYSQSPVYEASRVILIRYRERGVVEVNVRGGGLLLSILSATDRSSPTHLARLRTLVLPTATVKYTIVMSLSRASSLARASVVHLERDTADSKVSERSNHSTRAPSLRAASPTRSLRHDPQKAHDHSRTITQRHLQPFDGVVEPEAGGPPSPSTTKALRRKEQIYFIAMCFPLFLAGWNE